MPGRLYDVDFKLWSFRPMSVNHTGPTPGINPAGESPAQRTRRYASSPGAAEALPLHDQIKVEKIGYRVRLRFQSGRGRPLYVWLGRDGLAYLHGEISPFVFPVTVTRVEDRKAAGQ